MAQAVSKEQSDKTMMRAPWKGQKPPRRGWMITSKGSFLPWEVNLIRLIL